MKKTVFFLSTLIAGASMFTSCNKDLKDDIKDLQKKNSELQEKVDGIEAVLGANEPILAVTTFTDNDNVTRKVEGTYKFKASNRETSSMVKNEDGTYDIYIERFSDVEWYEGAWVAFTYNPTTKAVTHKRGGQYWDNADPFYDNARYDEDSYSTGLTLTITLNNIDVATGAISLNFTAAGTADYTNGVYYYYVPNQGKPVSTSFAFTGKLSVFTQE